jgi:hypothetical protein
LGLVRLLDRRALKMAFAELHRNRKLKLAVNVCATAATDRAWRISFMNHVRDHRKVADRLIIENCGPALFRRNCAVHFAPT